MVNLIKIGRVVTLWGSLEVIYDGFWECWWKTSRFWGFIRELYASNLLKRGKIWNFVMQIPSQEEGRGPKVHIMHDLNMTLHWTFLCIYCNYSIIFYKFFDFFLLSGESQFKNFCESIAKLRKSHSIYLNISQERRNIISKHLLVD